ncbi:cytochrome P450 [Camillea tinctor]|nr:cytochrome P450 [Camillea tinctor]
MPSLATAVKMTFTEYTMGPTTTMIENRVVFWVLPLMAMVLVVGLVVSRRDSAQKPPWLRETIPFVSNAWQYLTNMQGFLERSNQKLHKSRLVGFRLGARTLYLVTGAQNVQAMFRPSRGLSPDIFMLDIMEYVWAASKEELGKFRNDKSGRMRKPALGTEGRPVHDRYWASQHHLHSEFLARSVAANRLGELYYDRFREKVEKYPIGKWTTATVRNFCMSDMSESALTTFMGDRILELNPGFMNAMWKFILTAAELPWGLPRWMNPRPWRNRDQFHAMTRKYLESAWENFDWNGPDADADWEPHFGSRAAREIAKWMKETLSLETSAGLAAAFIFGTNANAVRMAMWGMIELIKDPSLYGAVREEINSNCLRLDPDTGARSLDAFKMLKLPILQSIYVETLRLHVSVNVTREVIESMPLDNYNVERGALLQAPSQLAHHDETVWGDAQHPASEFWAMRHITYTKKTDKSGNTTQTPEFNMAGRVGAFFPYGGGISICPGRHFAKQGIIFTLGTLVSRFDIDFIEWTYLDGSKSDCPAQNDKHFAGAVGMPPDRDIKFRWKRIW